MTVLGLTPRVVLRAMSLGLILSMGAFRSPDRAYAQGAPTETVAAVKEAGAKSAPAAGADVKAAPAPQKRASIVVAGIKQKIAGDSFNWRLYNDLGSAYYNEGRYDEAIAAYQQALALNPISRTMEAERQQQESADAQRKAMQQQQTAQALGLVFGALGTVGGAVGGLGGQAMQLAGQAGQIGAQFGNVMSQYIPGGQLDSQIKTKKEIAQIYDNLGDAYMAKGDFNQAGKSFEEAVGLDPSRMTSLQSAGSAYLRLAEYDKAASTLNRLLVLNPTDSHPILFLRLSLAYKHQGKSKEETETLDVAIKRLQALTAQSAKDPALLNSVADAYFELSYYEQAAQVYEQSLTLRKDQPVVLRRLGICYYAMGRYPDAARVLKEGVSLARNDSSGWLWLGRSLDKLGSAAEAQDAFNETVASDSEEWGDEPPPVPIAAGYAARSAGDNGVSIRWLEELLFRNPTSSYRAFELGLAYEKAGRYEDALDAFERSVALNPLDSLAKDALARVSRQLADKAAEDLQKAEAAIAGRRSTEAVRHLASALQRFPEGKAKQDTLLKLLRLVAAMPDPPSLTEKGERDFSRGNAMLKSATNPESIDRAIMEFRSAIRRSPWWTNAYLNLGLAYAQRRLYRDSILYFKLYLIANPNAKNAGAVREQIYELEYKQEQEQRSPSLLSRLRYKRDYGDVVALPTTNEGKSGETAAKK